MSAATSKDRAIQPVEGCVGCRALERERAKVRTTLAKARACFGAACRPPKPRSCRARTCRSLVARAVEAKLRRARCRSTISSTFRRSAPSGGAFAPTGARVGAAVGGARCARLPGRGAHRSRTASLSAGYTTSASTCLSGCAILVPFPEIIDPRGRCRDITNIGRWGNGDVEVSLASLDELPYVLGLVRQSFER
jgi:hypothetical protein